MPAPRTFIPDAPRTFVPDAPQAVAPRTFTPDEQPESVLDAIRLMQPGTTMPLALSPEERAEIARKAGIAPFGKATEIGEAPGAMTSLLRRSLAKGGYQQAMGPVRKTLAAGYAAFATPFEAVSMAADPLLRVREALGGSPAPVAGPEIGDVLREGVGAGLLRSLGGGTLEGAILRPGRAESRLALKSPQAADILKYDLAEAVRAGEGGMVRGSAIERLRELGVTPKMAEAAVSQEEFGGLMDVMKRVRGTQGGLPGVEAGKKLTFKSQQLKQDTFDVLKSLNVEGKDAERAVRWIATRKIEPLAEYSQLMTKRWKPTSVSADNPFFGWNKSDFNRRFIIGGKELFHPQTVMGLDANTTEIFGMAHKTQDDIQKMISKYEALVNKIAPRRVGKIYIDQAESGVVSLSKLPEKQRAIMEAARNEIFNPLADLHGRVPGQVGFVQDYFPKFFTYHGIPKDAVLAQAQWKARQAGETWNALTPKQQGTYLIEAERFMKGVPKQYFFGNLSKQRVTEKVGRKLDLRTALFKYVHGAVRKFYMDQFYNEVKPLLSKVSDPALRRYALDYIDSFRGAMPGKFHTLSAATRMVTAWSKLGLNLTSPVLNLSQTSINTYTAVGAKTLMNALKMRMTPAGRKLLQESGVVLDTAKHELTGMEMTRVLNNVTQSLLYLFNKSERFNREVAMLAGYLQAQKQFPGASRAALLAKGRELVNRTQFEFSVLGRPTLMRNPTGAALTQFKLFGYNQLRFIKSLRGEEVPRFALAIALHGGMKGIPGAEWVARVIWGIEAIQALKDSDMPPIVENALIGGLPRAAGMSMEQDVGVGFVPSSAKEWVPPFAAFPLAIAQNAPAYFGKQGEAGVRAGERLLSESVRSAPGGVQAERIRQALKASGMGGFKMSATGMPEDRLSKAEIVALGMFGAKTRRAAEARETAELVERAVNKVEFATVMFHKMFNEGIARENYQQVKEAFQFAVDSKLFNVQIGERQFMPTTMRRWWTLPEQARMDLFMRPQFREILSQDAQALMEFLGKLPKTMSKAPRTFVPDGGK